MRKWAGLCPGFCDVLVMTQSSKPILELWVPGSGGPNESREMQSSPCGWSLLGDAKIAAAHSGLQRSFK